MSKVPKKFPPEGKSGSRCGDSWPSTITVTGKLPEQPGFGGAFTHKLLPVSGLSAVSSTITQNEDAADALRDAILRRVTNARKQLGKEPIEQQGTIEWLLTHVEAEVANAWQLFDKWEYRDGGAFPMSAGDGLADFPFAPEPGKCGTSGYGAQLLVPGSATGGRPIAVWCPTADEMQQRIYDRNGIRRRFIDALRHLRCAEYWLWRLTLIARAREKLPGAGPGGFKPGSAPQPEVQYAALHYANFGAPVEAFGTFVGLPDPEDLPDPVDVEGEGEDDAPEAPPPPDLEAKPFPVKKVALAAGAAALGWMLFG